MTEEVEFTQSGDNLREPALPAVLNRRHIQGWNEAIDAAAQVMERTIEGMKAHTNANGMVTGADFFATELAYLEPVLEEIRALKIHADSTYTPKE